MFSSELLLSSTTTKVFHFEQFVIYRDNFLCNSTGDYLAASLAERCTQTSYDM